VRTLADHSRTVAALHALATEYPLLPAARIELVPHAPTELMVSCFGSLSDFEQWREALHADPAEAEYEVTAVGQIRIVAAADFDGVTVLIHGYSPQARPQKAEVAA
jgi:hypothetical protein